MYNQRFPVVVFIIMIVFVSWASCSPTVSDFPRGFKGYCDAALGECGKDAQGTESDGAISRRMLLAAIATRYISYGALSRDRVPCSQAGRSYYNCRGSGPANPYSRGCSRITHCYRDTS